MLSKILTLVCLVIVSGCEDKKYQKSENPNISVVEQLNSSNHLEVISKFSQRTDLNERESYYLASAFSQAGAVDVFSLYPVLEIQLFHKNALDWKELSADKNPYLRFFKTQSPANSTEVRRERGRREWNREESRFRRRFQNLNKPSYQEIVKEIDPHSSPLLSEEIYNSTDLNMKEKKDEILEKNLRSFSENADLWYDFTFQIGFDLQYNLIYRKLSNHYSDLLEYEHRERKKTQPELYDGSVVDGVSWETMLLTVLWNIYEAVPVIKKLPELSPSHQDRVTEASEEYLKLIDSDKFYEVSLKNLGILTSVSIISYYKESVNIEEVSNIQDLLCRFDAKSLIENYPMIRKRLLVMSQAYHKVKDKVKISDSLRESIEKIEETLPAELSPEEQERYIQEVDNQKERLCFSD